MVTMQYFTFEYLRNTNIILTHYEVEIYITSSTKRTVLVCTQFYIQPLGWDISVDICRLV